MKCLEKALLPRAGSLSVSWPAAIGSHSHNIKSRVRAWVSSALWAHLLLSGEGAQLHSWVSEKAETLGAEGLAPGEPGEGL